MRVEFASLFCQGSLICSSTRSDYNWIDLRLPESEICHNIDNDDDCHWRGMFTLAISDNFRGKKC